MQSVDETEQLTRFLVYRSQFSIQKGDVKYSAFMPHKERLDLSVFRTSGLDEEAKWHIGLTQVHNPAKERNLRASADFHAESAFNLGLNVIREPSAHDRHANITGFPQDRKQQQRIATHLARNALLTIIPPRFIENVNSEALQDSPPTSP